MKRKKRMMIGQWAVDLEDSTECFYLIVCCLYKELSLRRKHLVYSQNLMFNKSFRLYVCNMESHPLYISYSMIETIIGRLVLSVLHQIWWILHNIEKRYIWLVAVIWIKEILIEMRLIIISLVPILIYFRRLTLIKVPCSIVWMLEIVNVLVRNHHLLLLLGLILYHFCMSLILRGWIIIEDCTTAANFSQSWRIMSHRVVRVWSISVKLHHLLLSLQLLKVLLLFEGNLLLLVYILIVIQEVTLVIRVRWWQHQCMIVLRIVVNIFSLFLFWFRDELFGIIVPLCRDCMDLCCLFCLLPSLFIRVPFEIAMTMLER